MSLSRLTLAILALSLSAGVAMAKSTFKTKVPNGAVNNCFTCHTKTSPPAAWNSFGLDVKANMNGNSPDWAAVCGMDSDGDGWTNGEELLDPDCVWSIGDPMPGASADVTKPGDANDAPPEPEPEPEPDVIDEPDIIDEPDVIAETDADEIGPESDAIDQVDADEPGPEPDVSELLADGSDEPVIELDTFSSDIQDCESTSDCPEGYGCNDGICYPWMHTPNCTSDSDCAEGQTCEWIDSVSSECVPDGDGPSDPVCTSDSDCGEAQTCVEVEGASQCEDIVCESDDDCPGGFQCTWPANSADDEAEGSCTPTGGSIPDDESIPSTPTEDDSDDSGGGGGGGCGTGAGPHTSGVTLLALLFGLAAILRRRQLLG